jgi:hypothetical protein
VSLGDAEKQPVTEGILSPSRYLATMHADCALQVRQGSDYLTFAELVRPPPVDYFSTAESGAQVEPNEHAEHVGRAIERFLGYANETAGQGWHVKETGGPPRITVIVFVVTK